MATKRGHGTRLSTGPALPEGVATIDMREKFTASKRQSASECSSGKHGNCFVCIRWRFVLGLR